jgi:hypothetical protein
MLVIAGLLVKYLAYTAYIFGAIRAVGTGETRSCSGRRGSFWASY